MNHEEIARRVGRVYLTRCPYCGFDFLDIPPKPGVQYRCFGCSAYISQDMLVDNVDISNFEGDGERVLCPHCGWHWEDPANAPGACPGCMNHVSREQLVSERDFAGLDRPYVEVTQVDEKRKSRQGWLIVLAVVFIFWMFIASGFVQSCGA
jgi:predicted Zn-ribbon and HTH transcriptional regulator